MQATETQINETQIVDSRTFNAPRELVFQMFTDAEHITHWWGPRGFTTKTERMDVVPGGMWIHTMISADGIEYPNEVRYVEVESPSKLIFDNLSKLGFGFRTTVTFTDAGPSKTEVHYQMEFGSKELRDSVVNEYGAVEGLRDTLSRFEEMLATRGGEEFVITREFDAPRELIYKCWTEPERLKEWFGPAGCKLVIKHADMRPGGTMVYGMETPDGSMMWGRWTFRSLTPPSHIVLVVSFVDEQENPIPHPFAPTLPVEMLSTTTLEEKDGKTRMTLRSRAMNASEEGKAAFHNLFGSMQQGWTGTLDKLDAYLKTA